MNYMFYHCNSLKSINLSYLSINKLEDISNMFAFCSNVKYLDIVSFKDADFYDNLFYGMSNNVKIKVNEQFINKIKNQVPSSWEIIINN